ncbi:MAG: DUF4301 family protein, partial [Bacteroidales bacterium]|nr:DUF4301 family protein [Bacteroidales bacterium]
KIVGPATPHRGIRVLSEEEADAAIRSYESAEIAGKCKFVPASGAASRMFKDIFSGLAKLEGGEDLDEKAAVTRLAACIRQFAFYTPELFGEPQDTAAYRKDVAEKVLTDKGLGYGSKPKGVIKFHRYPNECRTAFAEHLVEAQDYMRNADGTANLVVTISPEHKPLFEAALAEVQAEYEARYGVKYQVKFTFQDKATDTVAVDPQNKPFRTEKGELLFRPAGHGALIYNLNQVPQEVVSIKNIDNVSNERMLPITARYKKVLLGKALELRDTLYGYLRAFDAEPDPAAPSCRQLCDKVESFLDRELCIQLPLTTDPAKRVTLLRSKLDRPVRVCGMVRNEGEPGGGPFIIAGKDGSSNLQILESVQINPEDPRSKTILANATHFNPVDLVCCLKNYKGEKFDLLQYVDEDAGFISSKSYQGRELKALELPGLWNGAMSDWNTLFVEVPLETFNPVKVVLDLLRPAHQ